MTRQTRSWLLLAAVGSAAASAGWPLWHRGAAASRSSRHVVLISIDGLLPEDLARPHPRLRLPALEALGASGVTAGGLEGVYPSLTYPSHATLVTGVRPARHGIFQEWRFEASQILAPTLWERAAAAGLTTAAVSWPVTVGASIDALIPEVPHFSDREPWLDTVRRVSTPGLVDEVVSAMGGFGPNDNRRPERRDRFSAAAAAHILRARRPNLLLVRFVEANLARYLAGRAGPEVDGALQRIDERVAEIVSAAAGLAGRTTFVVLGDHGFREAHTVLQPNVVLRRAGLLQTEAEGRIRSWEATAQNGAIRLRDVADASTAGRVRELFHSMARAHPSAFRVVEREELDGLGVDPGPLFFLEPREGYAVNDRFDGDSFLAPAPIPGHHRFLPNSPGMHAGLLLSGPGIREGASLPIVRQVDVAPTVAQLLGFHMPPTEGAVLPNALSARAHSPERRLGR